jgi:site-specific recombinase XerD
MYVNAVERWLDSGSNPQRYIDTMAEKYSSSTVNIAAHAIMRWYKWKGTPLELDIPSVEYPRPDYLNMNQIYALMNNCTSLLENVLVVVLFDTAVRISELLNLKISDINWRKGFIGVVRKGNRPDQVNIGPRALKLLKEYVDNRNTLGDDDDRVFMGLTYMDAWRKINAIGKRANIDVHPHILRHSRAIQMLMDNTEPYVVQQHLGHLRLSTTMDIYGKFIVTDLKKKIPSWETSNNSEVAS